MVAGSQMDGSLPSKEQIEEAVNQPIDTDYNYWHYVNDVPTPW